MRANTRDGTRGSDTLCIKRWPFWGGQPCELYACLELGATSSARHCPGFSLAGLSFSGSLQQMALFSSVSSPLLLEVSLGESVLKELHWFPSPILHEASGRLVKGYWHWEGAGGGTRILQGHGGPKWQAGHASAWIQLGFSFCSYISSSDPFRKPILESSSYSTFLISLTHSREGEPFMLLTYLYFVNPILLGTRAPLAVFSQLPEIIRKRQLNW